MQNKKQKSKIQRILRNILYKTKMATGTMFGFALIVFLAVFCVFIGCAILAIQIWLVLWILGAFGIVFDSSLAFLNVF